MVDSYSAGGVVVNELGQVVVVNQNNDSWSLPKGHIDPGENPLEAAKREIYEEAGVTDLEFIKDLGTYSRFKMIHGAADQNIRKNITMFLFKTKQKELSPTDPENPQARWVNKDNVADLLSFDADKDFFRSILKYVL